MPKLRVNSPRQRVPPRALAISVAAFVVPVAAVWWLPEWATSSVGMLIWLTALIPAFLLSYYRGLQGVAIALAGGMAVITATQVSLAAFDIAEPNWTLLGAIVAVYFGIAIGIAILAEVLRGERQAAEDLALIDRLTELPNRRHLETTIDREFAAAERGRNLCVVLFDLDRFKLVNDKHGHAAGDMTLKAFAKVLKGNTRKENFSARLGGEEFVTVLRDSDADGAVIFAQRILDQLRAWPLPWGPQTVSAGIAQHVKGMGSPEVLLSHADRALYDAKEGGRDMVVVAPRFEAAGVAAKKGAPAAVADKEAPLPRGTGAKLYVVDDDSAVRSALKRILLKSGYVLWDTGDPVEAIQRFTDSKPFERPDLILTDVVMPPMTGMRMIDQIAKVNPAVRVIYMSGYVQSEFSWEGTPGAVHEFLEKPIEMRLLLQTVERVLRAEPKAPPPAS